MQTNHYLNGRGFSKTQQHFYQLSSRQNQSSRNQHANSKYSTYTTSKKKLSEIHSDLAQLQCKFTNFQHNLSKMINCDISNQDNESHIKTTKYKKQHKNMFKNQTQIQPQPQYNQSQSSFLPQIQSKNFILSRNPFQPYKNINFPQNINNLTDRKLSLNQQNFIAKPNFISNKVVSKENRQGIKSEKSKKCVSVVKKVNKTYALRNFPKEYFDNVDLLFQLMNKKKNRLANMSRVRKFTQQQKVNKNQQDYYLQQADQNHFIKNQINEDEILQAVNRETYKKRSTNTNQVSKQKSINQLPVLLQGKTQIRQSQLKVKNGPLTTRNNQKSQINTFRGQKINKNFPHIKKLSSKTDRLHYVHSLNINENGNSRTPDFQHIYDQIDKDNFHQQSSKDKSNMNMKQKNADFMQRNLKINTIQQSKHYSKQKSNQKQSKNSNLKRGVVFQAQNSQHLSSKQNQPKIKQHPNKYNSDIIFANQQNSQQISFKKGNKKQNEKTKTQHYDIDNTQKNKYNDNKLNVKGTVNINALKFDKKGNKQLSSQNTQPKIKASRLHKVQSKIGLNLSKQKTQQNKIRSKVSKNKSQYNIGSNYKEKKQQHKLNNQDKSININKDPTIHLNKQQNYNSKNQQIENQVSIQKKNQDKQQQLAQSIISQKENLIGDQYVLIATQNNLTKQQQIIDQNTQMLVQDNFDTQKSIINQLIGSQKGSIDNKLKQTVYEDESNIPNIHQEKQKFQNNNLNVSPQQKQIQFDYIYQKSQGNEQLGDKDQQQYCNQIHKNKNLGTQQDNIFQRNSNEEVINLNNKTLSNKVLVHENKLQIIRKQQINKIVDIVQQQSTPYSYIITNEYYEYKLPFQLKDSKTQTFKLNHQQNQAKQSIQYQAIYKQKDNQINLQIKSFKDTNQLQLQNNDLIDNFHTTSSVANYISQINQLILNKYQMQRQIVQTNKILKQNKDIQNNKKIKQEQINKDNKQIIQAKESSQKLIIKQSLGNPIIQQNSSNLFPQALSILAEPITSFQNFEQLIPSSTQPQQNKVHFEQQTKETLNKSPQQFIHEQTLNHKTGQIHQLREIQTQTDINDIIYDQPANLERDQKASFLMNQAQLKRYKSRVSLDLVNIDQTNILNSNQNIQPFVQYTVTLPHQGYGQSHQVYGQSHQAYGQSHQAYGQPHETYVQPQKLYGQACHTTQKSILKHSVPFMSQQRLDFQPKPKRMIITQTNQDKLKIPQYNQTIKQKQKTCDKCTHRSKQQQLRSICSIHNTCYQCSHQSLYYRQLNPYFIHPYMASTNGFRRYHNDSDQETDRKSSLKKNSDNTQERDGSLDSSYKKQFLEKLKKVTIQNQNDNQRQDMRSDEPQVYQKSQKFIAALQPKENIYQKASIINLIRCYEAIPIEISVKSSQKSFVYNQQLNLCIKLLKQIDPCLKFIKRLYQHNASQNKPQSNKNYKIWLFPNQQSGFKPQSSFQCYQVSKKLIHQFSQQAKTLTNSQIMKLTLKLAIKDIVRQYKYVETNMVKEFLQIITGCTVFNIKATSYHKLKNLHKHENVQGFTFHRKTKELYQILGCEEIQAKGDGKEDKFVAKLVRLRKRKGIVQQQTLHLRTQAVSSHVKSQSEPTINLLWCDFLSQFKHSLIGQFSLNYQIRSLHIKNPILGQQIKTRRNFVFTINCQRSLKSSKRQKQHCLINVNMFGNGKEDQIKDQDVAKANKGRILVYYQKEPTKFKYVGSGDLTFISMRVRPGKYLIILDFATKTLQNMQQAKIIINWAGQSIKIQDQKWSNDYTSTIANQNTEFIKYDKL